MRLAVLGQDAGHHLARKNDVDSVPSRFKPYSQISGVEDFHLRTGLRQMNPVARPADAIPQ